MQINPDKYEKQGININYLANYENSITFIEVLKIIIIELFSKLKLIL
jgi:hypothetical protein